QGQHAAGRRTGHVVLTAGGPEHEAAAAARHQIEGTTADQGPNRVVEQVVLTGQQRGVGDVQAQDVTVDRTQRQVEHPMGSVDLGGAETGREDDLVSVDLVGGGDAAACGEGDGRYVTGTPRAGQGIDGGGGQGAGVHLVVTGDEHRAGHVPGQRRSAATQLRG